MSTSMVAGRTASISGSGITNTNFLKSVPLFQALCETQLNRLMNSLSMEQFEDREPIITQGEDGDAFYIVVSGRVLITRVEADANKDRNSLASPGSGGGGGASGGGDVDEFGNKVMKLKSLVAGDYFGERALLLREPRAASCTSEGGTRCLKLGRDAFDEALSNVQDLLGEQVDAYSYANTESSVLGLQNYAEVYRNLIDEADVWIGEENSGAVDKSKFTPAYMHQILNNAPLQ